MVCLTSCQPELRVPDAWRRRRVQVRFLSDSERATVLAALSYWADEMTQAEEEMARDPDAGPISPYFMHVDPLSGNETAQLIEEIEKFNISLVRRDGR